jgi:SAM-dependent methyltransferase
MKCPLCNSNSFPFYEGFLGEYERCDTCKGIFLLPQYHLSKSNEKKRYEKHNNNVEDPRYQKFVQPLVDAIKNNYSKDQKGLDFGCGEGPVISYLLEMEGYDIDLYDPLFYDEKTVFRRDYDYIILSEVMEHFNSPKKEFETLFPMLKPNGKIFCLTELYHENIDFSKWHYKDDETHVFFYDIKTISYISKRFRRPNFEINGRLIIF